MNIVAFFALAIVLGSGTIYLVVQGTIPADLALASVLSASIAGIVMTAVEDGSAGLKLILQRLLIWRVGIGYWIFAGLFLVPAILIGSTLNPCFNGDPLMLASMRPGFGILPMFVIFFIVSGLGQEIGWTGYLITRLQTRFSALTACFLRAVLATLWHLPLLLYSRQRLAALADFPYAGWIDQAGFLATIAVTLLMFQVPWAIFFTWIFNNTRGSLLLVAVLHGSEVWTAYWMLRNGIEPDNLNNYWGYGAVLVAAAAVIVFRTGRQNLSRTRQRVVHSSQ